MNLQIPEAEARELYRRLHASPADQERFEVLYRELQRSFFEALTVQEIQELLQGAS